MNKFYLIDNNILYLASLQSQLRSIGYNVLADHGNLGEIHTFRNILKYQPDIIIMDLVFPSFKGLPLLHRLQSEHYTNHIPIVVYTSGTNKHLEVKSIDKGIGQFVVKEVLSPERLIARVSKIY